MAQKYLLVPLGQELLVGLDLVSRAVLGAIFDRLKLSNYRVVGGDTSWYDDRHEAVYCVFAQSELADLIGVSERSIQRALKLLRDEGLIFSYKPNYQCACRFFLHERIYNYLKGQ